MKKLSYIAVVALTICSGYGVASGGRTTVDLRAADVSVHEPSDTLHGDYFVVDVDIPDGLTRGNLLGAILEFYMDVDVRSDTVLVEEQDTSYTVVHWNPAPLVEVYALNSASGSAQDSENWNEALAFPVPIGMGEDKIVKVNITRLVKYYMANPTANHGIVVGSLTGTRNALYTLREGFGQGVFARIRYIY